MKLTKSAMSVSATALALAAGSSFFAASPADAVEIYKGNGTVIEFTAEIGSGIFHVTENYNTLGGYGSAQKTPLDDTSWAEYYGIMGFKFTHDLSGGFSVYGALTGVANGDTGQGDAIGSTIGDEGGVQVQDAYGGVKWTDGKEGGASVNLSGGRQKWVLGDGFLIAGDQPTGGKGFGESYNEDGGYYMNPRRVFGTTAILNVETGTPLRFDAFYIQSEKAQNGKRAIAGGNVDYVDKTYGTLGFTYIRGLSVDREDLEILPFTESDGLNVYNVHGNSSFGIKDFNLAGTFVWQNNDKLSSAGQDHEAWAWYISPSYTFSDATWTPTLYYRFASFSGDDASTAGTNEGYDPLFYGATGYNTWFIGEIAANYSGPFSSNEDVHSLGLKMAPNIDVGIGKWTGLSGYVNFYSIRETAPGASDYFGTEFAAYAEFQLFDNLYVAPLYSVLLPGQAYEDAFGRDDTVHNFQLLGILTY